MFQLTQRQIAKKSAVINLDYTGGMKETNLQTCTFQTFWIREAISSYGQLIFFPTLNINFLSLSCLKCIFIYSYKLKISKISNKQ